MKIGINVSFLAKPMTGIGEVTREFLKAISKHPEFTKHTWYFYTDGELSSLDKPLAHLTNCFWREVKTWWPRQDVPHQYFFEKFSVCRAVEQDELDVFLSLYQSATLLPSSIRHVMVVHDLVPLHFPEYLGNWRKKWHYRKVVQAIRGATKIITISLATAKDLSRRLSIPKERVVVAPLGVGERFKQKLDETERASVLHRYGLAQGGYLYHGGGLEIRKNTARLLRAYASLIPRLGKSLPPLVISGKVHAESNPLATPVHTIVAQLEIASRVRILGFVPEEDLPALYSGAQAFLYPSLFEGFGLPIVEAFSRGTPVLTSQGGATEEVAAGAACLVDPMSEESLAHGIERLVREENYRTELAHAGRKRSEIFSWIQFTETVAKFLVQ